MVPSQVLLRPRFPPEKVQKKAPGGGSPGDYRLKIGGKLFNIQKLSLLVWVTPRSFLLTLANWCHLNRCDWGGECYTPFGFYGK
jgi:hypothetical protein